MSIPFPNLPYPIDALEPHISARTLEFHHGKHHKKYVDTANEMIEGTDLDEKSMQEIAKTAAADPSKKKLFNNAAQAWNHAFFWQCLKKGGGGKPTGRIADKIQADFGGYDKFVEEFKSAGASLFGSGWVWLTEKDGKLNIMQGANADTPFVHGEKPLFVIDVWEHAYYLDYQNRRPDFLQAVIDNLINWDFVNENLG